MNAPQRPVEIVGMPASMLADPRHAQFYSESLGNLISDLYAGGMSLLKIAVLDSMPSYATILRWAKEKPEFMDSLRAARAVRALNHEERAISVATEQRLHKDQVPAARLAFEAHKWAAEVTDPVTYGKRLTHQGDSDKPVVFKVITGFPDPLPHQADPKLGPNGLVTEERPAPPANVEDAVVVPS